MQTNRVMPMGNRILVKRLPAETVSKGGLLLPDVAHQQSQFGEVLAVGPGRRENGERIPLDLAVGDRILLGAYGCVPITVDGEELMIVTETDVDVKR